MDTSNYSTNVNGTEHIGLPDPFDSLKTKDFFAIYAARYCSGMKQDGQWKVDFCSYGGKEIFYQHELWRVWGVNFGAIGKATTAVFALTVTLMSILMIDMVIGYAVVYYHQMVVVNFIFSLFTAAVAPSLAAIAYNYSKGMADHSRTIKGTGKGSIVVKQGKIANSLLLASAACNIAASIFWLVMYLWDRKTRKRSMLNEIEDDASTESQSITSSMTKSSSTIKINDFGGIVRRTTDKLLGVKSTIGMKSTEPTGYQTLDDDSVPLTEYHSSTMLHTNSMLEDKSSLSNNDTAYEPF